MIQLLQKKKVPIGGIGVQGHFMGTVHPEIIKVKIKWCTESNLFIKNLTKYALIDI